MYLAMIELALAGRDSRPLLRIHRNAFARFRKQHDKVWIDALTNYLTVLGGPEAVARQQRDDGKAAFWAASNHMIAKDILRFHAVYWPAMLMSAGLPPPKQVFCHGYLTVKGQKISKSMPATKVDPNAIAQELGVDPLRYFVLREYTLGADGDFTYEALFQRYKSDLGDTSATS